MVELEREICELAAHLAAATCRWLLLVAEFDDRRGWAADGILSCAHWLSWRCSIGLRTAREHVRVAHRLNELPLVRESFGRGELSYCKVRALTRVATAGNEQGYVELARHATGAQLEKVVRCYRGAVKASTEQANRAHQRSADNRPGARRADALVAVARGSLDRHNTDRVGGDPVEVVVHVDAATIAAEQVQARSELQDGPSLAPETARRLGCDAALVRIIEKDGKPLSISRRTRTIPPALRRALRARGEGCAFPGCTHTRYLHAHHIHHWARGGPTKLDKAASRSSAPDRRSGSDGPMVEKFPRRRPSRGLAELSSSTETGLVAWASAASNLCPPEVTSTTRSRSAVYSRRPRGGRTRRRGRRPSEDRNVSAASPAIL